LRQIGLAGKKRLARLMRLYPMRLALMAGLATLTPRHRVGVNLVPLDAEGRVLLLKHVFHPFVPWGLPGGWLSRGEDPEACVLRELGEETGLGGRLGPLVLAASKPYPRHLVLVYAGYVTPGAFSLSSEIIEAGWFGRDTLPQPLLQSTSEAINITFRLWDQGVLEYA
jgi:ADP-ribose pyrophosphatase YjhB (NUDIX family)